jgi:two-component sensor histidine kinase
MSAHLNSFLSFKDPEAALREPPELIEFLPIAICACDADGRLRWFNGRAVELWGRRPHIGDMAERFCGSFKLFALDGSLIRRDETPMAEVLRTGAPVHGREATVQRPNGSHVIAMVHIDPVKDASGKLIGAISCFHDNSALHRARGEVAEDGEIYRVAAERRQKQLLDELNYRVKNNMQMLHALLRGAQRETASEVAKAVLADTGQRVGAMAAAQQALYDAASPASFEIENFMNVICRSAQQTFGRRAMMRLDTIQGTLPTDSAMALALIVNEIVMLLIKRNGGETALPIAVSMTHEGDMMRLTVAAEHCRLAFEALEPKASGLGLIAGLAQQLRGTFRISPEGACIVEFPAARGG